MEHIINFDKYIKKDYQLKPINPNPFTIQHSSRSILYGKTKSGKSNLVLNLLFAPKVRMFYEKVFIYCKDPSEDKYRTIMDKFQKIEMKLSKIEKRVVEILHISTDINNINLDDFDPSFQTLVIFDDMITNKNLDSVLEIWIRGRKRNISSFFLSQSWYTIPKDIRTNTDYVILFRVNNKGDIDRIYNDTVRGVEKQDFLDKYNEVMNKHPFGFITIDNLETNQNRKVREGLI